MARAVAAALHDSTSGSWQSHLFVHHCSRSELLGMASPGTVAPEGAANCVTIVASASWWVVRQVAAPAIGPRPPVAKLFRRLGSTPTGAKSRTKSPRRSRRSTGLALIAPIPFHS